MIQNKTNKENTENDCVRHRIRHGDLNLELDSLGECDGIADNDDSY